MVSNFYKEAVKMSNKIINKIVKDLGQFLVRLYKDAGAPSIEFSHTKECMAHSTHKCP